MCLYILCIPEFNLPTFCEEFCIYIHEDWGSCREILNWQLISLMELGNFLLFVLLKMLFKKYVYIIQSYQIIRMKLLLMFFYYHFNAWEDITCFLHYRYGYVCFFLYGSCLSLFQRLYIYLLIFLSIVSFLFFWLCCNLFLLFM